MLGDRIRLEEREYKVRVEPDSPAYIVTLIPRAFFDEPVPPDRTGRYTRIFEYDR